MSEIFGKPSQSNQSSVSQSQNLGLSTSNSGSNSASQNTSTSGSVNNSNSNSNSSSGNQAFNTLLGGLSPQITNGTTASSSLAGLLGIGGDPAAQQSAFKNFQNSTGYQFGLDNGSQAITQNNAAKGLLNSGSTLKALDTYGQNYANTQFQNYLNPLMSLVTSGNQAAGTLGGAGGVSNSTSNSTSNGTSNSTSNGASLANSFGNSNSLNSGNSNAFSNGTYVGSTPGMDGFLGSILGAVGTGK